MTATWDAWNRLVKLVDPDTSDTLAEFAYDGRNFRVVGKSFAGGTLDETRHYYFTDSWQCLEERIDSSTDPERQHVWGIRYIDDLVLRDRDTTGNGTLDERLYFLPDANWNVTAVVDDSGAVQERIEYTPYGWPQFLSPTFSTRSGSSFDVRYTYTSREWVNLNEYCASMPTRFVDNQGLFPWIPVGCAAACALYGYCKFGNPPPNPWMDMLCDAAAAGCLTCIVRVIKCIPRIPIPRGLPWPRRWWPPGAKPPPPRPTRPRPLRPPERLEDRIPLAHTPIFWGHVVFA
jgi:hypothetical protein